MSTSEALKNLNELGNREKGRQDSAQPKTASSDASIHGVSQNDMVAIFQATTDMVSSLKPLVDKHGIHKVGVCVISAMEGMKDVKPAQRSSIGNVVVGERVRGARAPKDIKAKASSQLPTNASSDAAASAPRTTSTSTMPPRGPPQAGSTSAHTNSVPTGHVVNPLGKPIGSHAQIKTEVAQQAFQPTKSTRLPSSHSQPRPPKQAQNPQDPPTPSKSTLAGVAIPPVNSPSRQRQANPLVGTKQSARGASNLGRSGAADGK